jgi:hypothetical protein
LEELRPKTNQHAPDTGDGDLNGTLGDVLDNLSTLFQILVETSTAMLGSCTRSTTPSNAPRKTPAPCMTR